MVLYGVVVIVVLCCCCSGCGDDVVNLKEL